MRNPEQYVFSSITEMASVVDAPGRFAGMHFFNPVPMMKLVEVVRGLHTTDDTIEATKKLAQEIGKVPIVCKDSPAFVVNRMLNALTQEAVLMLEEGIASAEDIDTGPNWVWAIPWVRSRAF